MCRGKLRSGDQILHLWEERISLPDRGSSDEEGRFAAILVGPTTSNPSLNAVKATVSLMTEQKVFHPRANRLSRDAFL